MVKSAIHVALYLTGLTLVAWTVRSADALPFWSWSRPKMATLLADDFAYDTVFLGSSRMFRALQPTEFDRRMADLGHPTKSINLGLAGLRQHDVMRVGSWIRQHRRPSIKRVIIELHSFDLRIRSGDWFTDQEIEMHVPDLLGSRLISIAISPHHTLLAKLSQANYSISHTLANVFRIGQGPRIVDDLLAAGRGKQLPRTWELRNGGWEAFGDPQLAHVARDRKYFLENPDKTESVLADMVRSTTAKHMVGGFNHEAIQADASSWRAVGLEPIYVVMPTINRDLFGRDEIDLFARSAVVFDLDRPAENRPLYDLPLFYDASHYDESGAKVFSGELASRVVETSATEYVLPIRLPPHIHANKPMSTTVDIGTGGSNISVRVDNLPFMGDIAVVWSKHKPDAASDLLDPNNLAPDLAHALLKRTTLFRAETSLTQQQLAAGEKYYLQAAAMVDGKAIAKSNVVELAPPK